MARVLMLRTQREPLGAMLASRGHTVVHVPLSQILPTGDPRPAGLFDVVLVTSANALVAELPAHPVYAVGRATAQALEQRGIVPHYVGEAGGAEVVAAIPEAARILHVGAEVVSPEVDAALQGRPSTHWVVYRNEVPPQAASVLQEAFPVDVVVFLSKSQVDAYKALQGSVAPRFVVLGPSTEAAARSAGFDVAAVAERPTLAQLCEAVDRVSPAAR